MTDRSYRRNYPRYPMHLPVIFGWQSCVGEGFLTNLSFSGCSILCDRTALIGTSVRASILLPDHGKTLSIEGGTIKWAEDRVFGVEFLRLPLDARQRLNRTLRRALIHRMQAHSRQPRQANVPDSQFPGGGSPSTS